MGRSGTLGLTQENADEKAGGIVFYLRGHDAKLTFDASYLDGAPVNSSSLDIVPGDVGWLIRTQIQFGF
jgi:hypothetical protein